MLVSEGLRRFAGLGLVVYTASLSVVVFKLVTK